MISFSGKTALITGAAGGIGSAMCALFAELGAVVIACDRDEASLNRLTAAWTGRRQALHPFAADIADEQAVAAGLDKAAAHAGAPTILINNAGVAEGETLARMTVALWRRELDVNLTGAYIVFQAVLPHMLKAGGGAIVNIGSVNCLGYLGPPPHSAAKARLHSFSPRNPPP